MNIMGKKNKDNETSNDSDINVHTTIVFLEKVAELEHLLKDRENIEKQLVQLTHGVALSIKTQDDDEYQNKILCINDIEFQISWFAFEDTLLSNKQGCIEIENIREITVRSCKECLLKDTSKTGTPGFSIRVHYGTTFNLNVLNCFTYEQVVMETILKTLRYLKYIDCETFRGDCPTFLDDKPKFCGDLIKRWLVREWAYLDKNSDNKITLEQYRQFLLNANVKVQNKKVYELFESVSHQKDTINFNQFSQTYSKILYHQELKKKYCCLLRRTYKGEENDVDIFFDMNNETNKSISDMALQRFLLKEQYDTKAQNLKYVHGIIKSLKNSSLENTKNHEHSPSSITIDDFLNYLFNTKNSIFKREHSHVYQDMTKPLSHYWIASSHNTFISGGQLQSNCSLESYARVLRQGCRCIEVVCFDGPENEPLVHHGLVLSNALSLADVLQVVADNAFICSEYPLIISLQNHCSLSQQVTMATLLKKHLGKYLVTNFLKVRETKLPSPELLKYRIIIHHRLFRHEENNDQIGLAGNTYNRFGSGLANGVEKVCGRNGVSGENGNAMEEPIFLQSHRPGIMYMNSKHEETWAKCKVRFFENTLRLTPMMDDDTDSGEIKPKINLVMTSLTTNSTVTLSETNPIVTSPIDSNITVTSSITNNTLTSSLANNTVTSSIMNNTVTSSKTNNTVTSSMMNNTVTSSIMNNTVTSSKTNNTVTSSKTNNTVTSSKTNNTVTSLITNNTVTSSKNDNTVTSSITNNTNTPLTKQDKNLLHLTQPWFHADIDRVRAEKLLVDFNRGEGSFLVRPSHSFENGYSLTFWWDNHVKHIHIKQKRIEGGKKEQAVSDRLVLLDGGKKEQAECDSLVPLDGGVTRYYVVKQSFDSLYSLINYYRYNALKTDKLHLTLKEPIGPPEPHLDADWYHEYLSKNEAEDALANISIVGYFLVRKRIPNNPYEPELHMLSFNSDKEQVRHYRIIKNENIYCLDAKNEFRTLVELVECYKKHPIDNFTRLLYPCTRQFLLNQPPTNQVRRKLVACRVKYAYNPPSHRVESELVLKRGDLITKVTRYHGTWWVGDVNGQTRKWFPVHFTDVVEIDKEDLENAYTELPDLNNEKEECKDNEIVIHLKECNPKFISSAFQDRPFSFQWSKNVPRKITCTYEQQEKCLDTDTKPNKDGGSTAHLNLIAKELNELLAYCRSKPAIEMTSYKNVKYFEMTSFSELEMEKLICQSLFDKKIFKYHEQQLSRVYPKVNRFDSSNFNPISYWNFGTQICALNYQSPDQYTQVAHGIFADNGNCGYILQPRLLRDSKFNPYSNNTFPTVEPLNVSLNIVSARHLPKHGSDGRFITCPYIEVQILGLECDFQMYKTSTVMENGLSPMWFREDYDFDVLCPPLAKIHFLVKHENAYGDGVVIAQACFPLMSLRQGHRSVPLKNIHNEDIPLCAILVELRMRNAVEAQSRRIQELPERFLTEYEYHALQQTRGLQDGE